MNLHSGKHEKKSICLQLIKTEVLFAGRDQSLEILAAISISRLLDRHFNKFTDPNPLQQHCSWLDDIRQTIWDRIQFESETIPSTEACTISSLETNMLGARHVEEG